MQTVLLASMKGGTGKTTSAIALSAAWAAEHRKDVVLYDGDPQGTLTRQMRHDVVREPWLADPVPVGIPQIAARTSIFRGGRALGMTSTQNVRTFFQRPEWDDRMRADIALIDTPNGGIVHILEAADVADLLLIPVDTSPFGLEGLKETLDLLRAINPPIPSRVLLTRLVSRRKIITEEIIDYLDANHPGMRLETSIPEDARVLESHRDRRPLTLGPRGQAADAYRLVGAHLLKVLRGLRRVKHAVDRSALAGAGAE